MRDMAVQAANGSLSATEKGYLDTEQDKLALAINTALDQAKFANQDLAKATNASTVVTIQAGAGTADTISLTLSSDSAANATAMGIASLTTYASSASSAIAEIDVALGVVASQRATLGAHQAQLESTVRNLANVAENTAAAAGRVVDTDYASETANLTKAQILQQAATSVLAQANAQPQAVLALLQ